jgi:hypothetical protein
MIDFQTQLYILSATFGGVIFLLIILVLTLALSVARCAVAPVADNECPFAGSRSSCRRG